MHTPAVYSSSVLPVYLFGKYILVGDVTLLIKPHVTTCNMFSASRPVLEKACSMFLFSLLTMEWG